MATWLELGIDVDARRPGWQKVLCPWCSHTRANRREHCLSVNVDIGFYRCHHCKQTGWLESSDWREATRQPMRRTYAQPKTPPTDLHANALEWFDRRGIGLDVVRRNKITSSASTLYMPFYQEGIHVNTQRRKLAEKSFRMDEGARVIPFGVDDVGESKTLTIVEGIFDKLAIEQATGALAVLAMPGTSVSCLEEIESVLKRVERVVLAGDMDEPGKEAREEIARRVGRHRVSLVEWPEGCKDANDVLVECGAEVVAACLVDAAPFPLEGVIRPIDLLERVKALRKRATEGALPGWPNLNRLYRIVEGQMTVVTGVPSAGKSALLNAMYVNVARDYGWHFGMCSPETWPPEEHVRTLAEVYSGKPLVGGVSVNGERMGPDPLTDDELEQAVIWVNEHFTLVAPEPISIEAIIERAGAVHLREGMKGFVVDPWNRLGHTVPGNLSMTQYVGQVLARLQALARQWGCHVWVVAHPTKMASVPNGDGSAKSPIVRPYDISDSANFYNMADNVLSVYRDKSDAIAPVTVHVQKIRFRQYGELGAADLRFDRVTGRYREC